MKLVGIYKKIGLIRAFKPISWDSLSNIPFWIDPQIKINFTMHLVLVCDAYWVSIPKYFELINSTREFAVRVDPTALLPGVHAATYVIL